MIAKVRCNKCGMNGKFDLGDGIASVEQAQAKLDAVRITSCPFGNHIEFTPIGYTVLAVEAGQAPMDEEWLATMRADRDLWSTDDLRETEILIESFAFGMPMATVRGEDFWLDMMTSPEGHRYYWAPKKAYEKVIGKATAETGATQ